MGVQITHWDPWRPLRAVALQLRAYVEVCTPMAVPQALLPESFAMHFFFECHARGQAYHATWPPTVCFLASLVAPWALRCHDQAFQSMFCKCVLRLCHV